jgi:hypothetical protein
MLCWSPRFGQWCVWLLLVSALYPALLPYEPVLGVRQQTSATLIAILPSELLDSYWFYEAIRWSLIVSAVAWMIFKWIPWTCWTTCISYILLWALRIENSDSSQQVFQLTSMLLIIHAIWFHFYHCAIQAARDGKDYWQSPLYPRWVFVAAVAYIGMFHALAGFSKIRASGLDWGDGLSLQLWVYLLATKTSPLANLILASRTIARILQSSLLVTQTASILAVFNNWLRLLIGMLLVGFYLGAFVTFWDGGYLINGLLVSLFFLPLEPWLNRDTFEIAFPGLAASGQGLKKRSQKTAKRR